MNKPDLIILDQMMPGMEGMEGLRLLRASAGSAFIPVVIYSAVADSAFAEHAKKKGADAARVKGRVNSGEIPRLVADILAV